MKNYDLYEVYDETVGEQVSGKFYDYEDAMVYLLDKYGIKEEDYYDNYDMQEIVYVRNAE